MRRCFRYRYLGWLFCATFLIGCGERMNKRFTLWRNDKIPYGTYFAFQNLSHFFPDAVIETTAASPETFGGYDSSTAYIIVGNAVIPSDAELQSILSHIYSGNHVFISASRIGDNLLDSLKLTASNALPFGKMDSMSVSVYHPETYDSETFTYPGLKVDNHFTGMDSSITNIVGHDEKGNPNFIRINYLSGGSVTVQLAPAAFTNFFLLHKQNKRYYDIAMSSIPESVSHVRWDDYYRHHMNGRSDRDNSAFSKLGEILSNDMLRWAFWLTLLLFALIYLFDSKRKQRVVPVRPKLTNTSLDFVKTVGRLYYQRKDNKNLAGKMSTHFLAHVRNRYNLSTSNLDEQFEKRLAFKTGYSQQSVSDIIVMLKSIETSQKVTDEELLALHDHLNKFYKHS